MRATTREVTTADLDAVTAVWAAAERARKVELAPVAASPETAEDDVAIADRVARRLTDPTAFGVVAEIAEEVVAVAVATQATADDGLSFEPLAGVAHVPMVAVHPRRWGNGLGSLVTGELERLARDRGFARAQLWTHETNARGQRLYERLGWVPSGRTKEDQHGALLRHYVREL